MREFDIFTSFDGEWKDWSPKEKILNIDILVNIKKAW